MKNQLLIAAAGAGKTTYFVKEALACPNEVLITTLVLVLNLRQLFVETKIN